ncbi:MAG: 4Fe-4S ferredoxin [Desulfurococcales archaeon ex4484_217_1]|nr:MAG: 4Fe-4S ferredoxin [Desulfurococcales archaeon ex4484_217_1]
MSGKTILFRKLIHVNACSRMIRKLRKILIYGTCLRDEHPEILETFSKSRVPLAVCLEEEHMNMVGFKLATMMKTCGPHEIVVLTVDGSPHCVQLHMMVEECLKLVPGIAIKHYVIYKGDVIEVSPKVVKTARYLSKVKKLLGE